MQLYLVWRWAALAYGLENVKVSLGTRHTFVVGALHGDVYMYSREANVFYSCRCNSTGPPSC